MELRRKIRVVLADDHRVVRQGIRGFMMEDPDIEVVAEAEDGDEAIALIERFCPDVAVLDLQMPLRNGIAVTRWIREQQLPINVLILTAYDDDPYLVAALEAGVNGYLSKCADAEEIVQAVHKVACGGSILSTHIVPRIMKILATPQALETAHLSDREVEILQYAASGLTNKGIAGRLQISHRTVQGHLRRIFEKLEVSSRTEAVVKAAQLDLISLPD